MAARTQFGLLCTAVFLGIISGPVNARQQTAPQDRVLPDFDIRVGRASASASPGAAAELRRSRTPRGVRLNPNTGTVRVLEAPGLSRAGNRSAAAVRALVSSAADRLGLDANDLASLTPVRDYVSASTGAHHLVFTQTLDGIPVFDGVVSVHVNREGEVLRVNSGAARGAGRQRAAVITAAQAAESAARSIRPELGFSAVVLGSAAGPASATRFAPGGFRRDVAVSHVWFPIDGSVRLAWHVELEPDGSPQFYDLVVDAQNGDILLRRNRVKYENGVGRVVQSAETQQADPRRPDAMPLGPNGCPPPSNHELRSLNGQFRDPATVLDNSGRLSGNNAHVFRRAKPTEGAFGTFDGTQWNFDFPFNSADSAETQLFFALNFAHDFFYDLGFDEAAGNFQENNFGRGGLGGDSIVGLARATGRNNATFQSAPDGANGIISMYLWDGFGCWSQDVDGDGVADIDGDYDLDIVLHEYQHGVSQRLNTVFTGNEADAIGEGGGDFFAYSVNNNALLAEYSYPDGLRAVNSKGYGDWYCLLGFLCEPHDNGEIWANVLWDLRERFRVDAVRGSQASGVNEAHQLYLDALKLSPPSPTMLDMRDAVLLADALRNPGSPTSTNYCRIWETFGGRGMGLNATDTQDNGFNQVGADFTVPSACAAPPSPPVLTVSVPVPTATESGPVSGTFRISRSPVQSTPLTVWFMMGGTATFGVDYQTPATVATIPADAAFVDVPIVPIDDTAVETNETVTLTLRAASAYILGSPYTGTVTIVSDDVAPDMIVSALTVPVTGGSGLPIQITDTTKNQGTGAAAASTTYYYLSRDYMLDGSDPVVGTRAVPDLAVGATSTNTMSVTLPADLDPGLYTLFAKADGAGVLSESQEANNTRLSTIRIGPDLLVTTLTAPATAGAGTSFSVTDTTSNPGGGPATASTTRFYLSLNYLLDGADTPLQSRAVPALGPSGASTMTTTLTIPAGTPTGLYYIIANADDGGAVVETSEGNNIRYVTIRVGPDLTVTGISGPARGGVGDTIQVNDTTKNSGTGSAGPSTTVFYLSANYALDATDIRLNPTRSVGPLNAGDASSGTTSITVPDVTPGLWYLIGNADDSNAVLETTETNNTRYTTILIGPDLTVSLLTGPSTATPGSTVVMTDTTKNSGAGIAAASVTRFYLSTNVLFDASDILLTGERTVPALAANVTNTGTTNVVLPAGLTGVYYILAVADGPGTVAETNENNNAIAKGITIK
ncbi:MAG TPA: M36 family metallopeptidase [Vicinamibacterales bacterium]|nr:M36 family metallopeptidase [Vicinamibacterales bacterium]